MSFFMINYMMNLLERILFMKIKLSTIDDVKKFSSIACSMNADIDVSYGHYVIDGKSINVFSRVPHPTYGLVVDECLFCPCLDMYS